MFNLPFPTDSLYKFSFIYRYFTFYTRSGFMVYQNTSSARQIIDFTTKTGRKTKYKIK